MRRAYVSIASVVSDSGLKPCWEGCSMPCWWQTRMRRLLMVALHINGILVEKGAKTPFASIQMAARKKAPLRKIHGRCQPQGGKKPRVVDRGTPMALLSTCVPPQTNNAASTNGKKQSLQRRHRKRYSCEPMVPALSCPGRLQHRNTHPLPHLPMHKTKQTTTTTSCQ